MVLCEDNQEMSPRVECKVRTLHGDHTFALNGSTSVDFEVAQLTVKDLISNAEVVDWTILDKGHLKQVRVLFVAFKAQNFF